MWVKYHNNGDKTIISHFLLDTLATMGLAPKSNFAFSSSSFVPAEDEWISLDDAPAIRRDALSEKSKKIGIELKKMFVLAEDGWISLEDAPAIIGIEI